MMSEDANPWVDAPRAPLGPAPEPEPERRAIRPSLVLAGLLAVAASVGFALWLGAPDRSLTRDAPAATTAAPGPPPALPHPLRYAPPEPAPDQVRSAYGEARGLYVAGGPQALVKASEDCAKRLQADPSWLDACLAFDIYAADFLPSDDSDQDAAVWFHDGDERDLALARSALPAGVDATDRLEQVRALTTAVLPKPKLHQARRAPAKPAQRHLLARPAHAIRPRRTAIRHPARRSEAPFAARRDPAVPDYPKAEALPDYGPPEPEALPPH